MMRPRAPLSWPMVTSWWWLAETGRPCVWSRCSRKPNGGWPRVIFSMEYISRLAFDLAKLNHVSPARLAAFEILRRVEDGAFSSVLLAAKEEDLKQADRGLCHELVLGVLRWQSQLDKIIEYYA